MLLILNTDYHNYTEKTYINMVLILQLQFCFILLQNNQFIFLLGKEWEAVSDEAKDLVRKLLVTDSKKRLTAAQALKERWIVKHRKISEWSTFKPTSTIGSSD